MRNLKQKWIAWLAVICMLAAMVPATALAVMADGDPIFSNLQVQFIGRLPIADKTGVYVSLSNDGETWTDAVEYKGHAADRWGCANTVDYAYFGVIDVTEQAKSLTSDRFFVKVGLGAADITWTVLHQVRVVGIYTGSTSETEFFWEDYSNLNAFARTGDNAEAAAADVVKQVPYAVSANNVFLQQCNVDHQATGLSPYHGGYYGEPENVNAHVVYGINQPAADGVYFEFLGRMPGDVNDANKVQVMVGSDGNSWKEAALLEGPIDNHSDSTRLVANITDAVDLTANNLYVKVNLISYLAEWCSARQMRVVHIVDGVENVLMDVNYDNMAIGSEDYKSGLYVDSANVQLRGTYDPAANDPSGLTMSEDCDGQDGKGLGDNYITYKIPLREPEVTGGRFSNLKLQFIHRLPSQGDTDAKSALQIFVSGDGENWSDAYVHATQDSGKWGCDTFTTIDLSTLAANVTGNKLYIKVGMGAGDNGWCLIHQLRVEGTYADETAPIEFVWDQYEGLTPNAGTDNATAAAEVIDAIPGIVDANNVKLASCVVGGCGHTGIMPYYGGSYEETAGYITYAFDLKEVPVEPEEPSDKVYFEIYGRLPGDENGANLVQVQVGTDGATWNEATQYEGPIGEHSSETYAKIDITDAVDLTANNLYIKVNPAVYLAEWYSIRQIRVTRVAADGTETTLLYVIYDDMAIGSEDYKSGLYVDSANVQLRGTYDAAGEPSGLTVSDDCEGQDGKGLGDAYITYKIVLKEEPEEPSDKVYFEIYGRLPGDENGTNLVQVLVGTDGATWNEATQYEGPIGEHSSETYAKIDITDAVDLTANNLYIKVNPAVYLAEWYSIRQIRVTKVGADGETTLLYVIYDDMAIGSEDYKSGLYVDSANVQLRGTYDAAGEPSGLTVSDDCEGQDGKGLGDAYITYMIVLKEPEMPYAYGGNSVSEDVSGLANIYNLTIDGIAVKENTTNVADFTNATFNGYKLLSVGAIATNGVASVDINGVNMYALNGNEVSFAFRVINIPADMLDVEITMTLYVVVEIDGVATTLYGEPTTASYNSVLNG